VKPVSIRLEQFTRALRRLQEAIALPKDPIVQDACIQRFEFTFETAWKAIQEDARAEGVDCASPRDCFRVAFRLGVLTQDEPRWLSMVHDRNRTSHTYDEAVAAEIYDALSGYTTLFDALLTKLEERARQRAREEAEGK
jgi:nucleotidyltransferase substrate binding protein (TIGR01987 family)